MSAKREIPRKVVNLRFEPEVLAALDAYAPAANGVVLAENNRHAKIMAILKEKLKC